jgi:predicted dehydrogenase
MTMERLRVGVVGCGGIAQMMHLPYLRELDDRFEIAALADTNASTLEQVADHYGVTRRHHDIHALLAEPLDAVLIATSGDHTEATLAAIERGRHVLVEKPLSYTLRQTDAVIERSRRAGTSVMVGMMKRFDPGYRRGVDAVQALRDLRYVDVRTLQADDAAYRAHHRIFGARHGDGVDAERLYGSDFDAAVQRGILNSEAKTLLEEAAGSTDPALLTAYVLLISSSIHDVNVLKGILGRPEGVVSAHLWAGGTSFTALLAYPHGVHLTYTWTLLPYLKHYQGEFSFFAADGRVHIRFPAPYLRNEPTLIDLEAMDGEVLKQSRLITSYEEAFKLELIHFHECVTQARPPLTDAAGYREDLELLIEITRHLSRTA